MKAMNGLALAVAMAAVVACQSAGGWIGTDQQELIDGGKPPCPTGDSTCVEVSPRSALDGACTEDRQLALFNADTDCLSKTVAGGTWQGSKLFDEGGAPAIPPGLQRYCLYEWSPSSTANPPNVTGLAGALGDALSKLEHDCFVVGPSGSSAGVDAGWRTMLQSFREQTGWLPELPPGVSGATAQVRVAVVDTAPNFYDGGTPSDDRSGHGEAVGRIIRDHACPDAGGTCIGQIADRLAMPRITVKTKDPFNGGYFGSEGEVAKAIHGAVHAWRAFKAGGGNQPRLVINLSLGWDPGWGGDPSTPSAMPLGTRAVYAAITHAVCQGALVIAAAGNDPGGPGIAQDPMYPGGWETQRAPTAAQCAAFEGGGYDAGGTYPLLPTAAGVYNPLVFAVSGVRANDRLLLNARSGGRARLVAPGAHALATGRSGPTTMLYGTSAAAAVTSAAAAAVWGYRPSLTAPEVMELLRSSGTPLAPTADFCLGSSHPCKRSYAEAQVVRVNLCEAIHDACSGGLEYCPAQGTLPTCTPRPAYEGTPPRLTDASVAAIQAAATTTYDASPVEWALAGLATCEDSVIVTTGPRYPASPCPKRQYFGTPARPWSGPQPSTNACPVCTIGQETTTSTSSALTTTTPALATSTSALTTTTTTTYTVTLSIDDEYRSSSLANPVLRINGEYDIDLSGVGTLEAGDVAVIKNLDLSAIPSIESAEIQFRLVDGLGSYSSESELIVQ